MTGRQWRGIALFLMGYIAVRGWLFTDDTFVSVVNTATFVVLLCYGVKPSQDRTIGKSAGGIRR